MKCVMSPKFHSWLSVHTMILTSIHPDWISIAFSGLCNYIAFALYFASLDVMIEHTNTGAEIYTMSVSTGISQARYMYHGG